MTDAVTDDAEERMELSPEQEALFQRTCRAILNSSVEWLSRFPEKFYSMGYMLAVMRLFAQPGMKKSELALFLEINAKVSRSTAERMIKEAEEYGIFEIKDNAEGAGLSISLSPTYYNHAVVFIAWRLKDLIKRAENPGAEDFFANDHMIESAIETSKED